MLILYSMDPCHLNFRFWPSVTQFTECQVQNSRLFNNSWLLAPQLGRDGVKQWKGRQASAFYQELSPVAQSSSTEHENVTIVGSP